MTSNTTNSIFLYSTEAKWLAACAALAAGERLGFAWRDWHGMWPLAALAAAVTTLAVFSSTERAWRLAAIFAVGLALAMWTADARRRMLDDALEVNAGRPYSVTARVVRDARVTTAANGKRHAAFDIATAPVPLSVVAELPKTATVPAADELWCCKGWLDRERDDDIGRRRRLWIKGRGASVKLVAPPRGGCLSVLRALRRGFGERLATGLEDDPVGRELAKALVLGDRSGIDQRQQRVFVDSGTSHVFAISGLHVMVVAKMLSAVALFVFAGPRIAPLAVIPALWTYVAVTGSAPSAVRAATMASFQLAAPLFWRRQNGFVSWSLAFLAMHVVSPASIMNVGSQLSFAVMLALVLWGRWTSRFGKAKWNAMWVSAVAWTAGTPIVAATFGRFTPSGLVANVFMAGAAGAAVVAGVAGAAASFLSSVVAGYLNRSAALILHVMAGASEVLSEVPAASFSVRQWTPLECAAWYAVSAGALYLVAKHVIRRRARRKCTAWLTDADGSG